MPKLKTNSGAAKRFKATKNKKFKYSKAKRRHLLEWKSAGKSRHMRKSTYVHDADWHKVRQMMPYA
ncbi:MAG: 50S ribosomal protein L35 [Deltaproteobacteria bacterium]|nr:50S ribosomal protein L35 [Deltaproteobacteria bacterium]